LQKGVSKSIGSVMTCGLHYKHIAIINDTSRVVSD
jgi:hypothetical protein